MILENLINVNKQYLPKFFFGNELKLFVYSMGIKICMFKFFSQLS